VHQIFYLHGVDMGSKKLAEKLHFLSQKQVALEASEKQLLDICNKISWVLRG